MNPLRQDTASTRETDYANYHLAQLAAGASDADSNAVWAKYPDAPLNNQVVLLAWLKSRPELARSVLDIDISKPFNKRVYAKEPDEIPELPESAQLNSDQGKEACPWLNKYIEFSRIWSPRSFDGFHEATAIWVLSTIAARRILIHFGKSRYTNLYIMLAGRTTLHAKSSATDIGKQVLKICGLGYLLAADEATPQAFIRSLARNNIPKNYDDLMDGQQTRIWMQLAFGAQRGWYHEEFGSGLASMMRTDGVMADYRGLLRKFDDCPDDYTRETISRGVETVEKPYLALIANITPSDLKPFAKKGERLWGDGFLARFAFITPPNNEILRGRFPKGRRIVPAELSKPLVEWHKRLGIPDVHMEDVVDNSGEPTGRKTVEVESLPTEVLGINDDVWEAYYSYDHAVLDIARTCDTQDLDGNYGRLAEKALRAATLFASLGNCQEIGIAHWTRAQEIIERWRLYAHRLYEQVTELDYSEQKDQEEKALRILKQWQGTEKYPDGMTAADVARFIHGIATGEMVFILSGLARGDVVRSHKPKRALRYYYPGVNGFK